MKQICWALTVCIALAACQAKTKSSEDDTILVHSLTEWKQYLDKSNVRVKLQPGNYQIDEADNIRFIRITGDDAYFDLRGVRFMVNTKLFSRPDLAKSDDGNSMYCAIEVSGDRVMLDGLYIETYGDTPGRQSKNKMFNIVGEGDVLKDVEVRTTGSSPWGFGSLYGLGGGDVRKMNGIRVGYPAKDVKLQGCKVHMRAMGHAIFLQGAENTLIEDCHVDGLLRTTDAILAETSGYAFDRGFYARKGGYIEGTMMREDGKIVPGEIISLSEDGIRMYPEYNGHKTKNTTVKNCTVTQMRRGICTGLSTSGDKVIDCVVRDCVATGYNVGNADTLINCSADAKYAEAFCIPYVDAKNAFVEMNILDSRNGMANELLAKINGEAHDVIVKAAVNDYIPEQMSIKLSCWEGYGNFNKKVSMHATNIRLYNQTMATVIKHPGVLGAQISSNGMVIDMQNLK